MKYLILSKNVKKGIPGDDSRKLTEYFELGWEVVGSRIDFIADLNMGKIDRDNTTIVCIEDRMFFYEKIFDKVISFDAFNRLQLSSTDEIEDWTIRTVGSTNPLSFLNAKKFVKKGTTKYYRHKEDRDFIFNGYKIDKKIEIQDKYFVLGIRLRDHCSYRNSDLQFYTNLVNNLKTISPNVFVVGKNTEDFCKENECVYLNRLKDFVDLIKRPECISFIGQSTGTMLLAFCSAECPIHLIDSSKASDLNGGNAVLGGKCIQFTEYEINPHYSFSQDVIDKITKYCKDLN